ncbi:MAG: phosphoribosylformylglycinamidine synthase subunit PurS [Elusimicrobia bacterium]|nr:phosphoribosylformylglycinamidine synthase subunit PurS [Elusimicrobiota bacterium]
MATFIVEIHPKKAEYDPLARQVKNELIEAGENPKTAAVESSRLFRIEGNLSAQQIDQVASTLLVDPVVETAVVDTGAPSKKKQRAGWVLDIWPKPGVTDPVGETVAKGLKDLGIATDVKTASAQRYFFPKASDGNLILGMAKRSLANELIHDIHVRKTG